MKFSNPIRWILPLCLSVLAISCEQSVVSIQETEPIETYAVGDVIVVRGIHSYNPEDLPGLIWCDPGTSVCYVWVVSNSGVNGHPQGIYMEDEANTILKLAGASVDSTITASDGTKEVYINTQNAPAIYPGSWNAFVNGL